MKSIFTNVDEYIASFPIEKQEILEKIRAIIKKIIPNAEETISYAIPTFKLNGKNLVHFAAYKNHIGFYATPSGQSEFKEELSKYKQGKGSVQFTFDKAIPYDLIKKIVKFKAKEASKGKNVRL
ncbi:MAG: DUF1801 domain-containing protein [Leptospiraceae bacterium]|nr:DUF1801 domain-containing protein [Leptospiraceae bacterium]